MQLLRTVQTVYVYNKKVKTYENPLHEINIDIIPFETLITIVTPRKDDLELYENYGLTEHQLIQINTLSGNNISIDLSLYNYVICREGIYDWTK